MRSSPGFLGNNVSVIDASNQVTATVAVGTNPRGVAVNADGSRVYVTNQSSGTVSVIDTTNNNTVVATITIGGGPRVVALNADGTRAYVTNSGYVSVIDTTSGTVVATVTVGSSPTGVAVLG